MSLPRQWTRLAMLLFSVTCGISAFVHSRSIEQPPPTAVDPTSIATIDELYTQLEDLRECNRTVDSPLIRQMLNFSVVELERNQPLIFWLINLIAKHSYLVEKSMPLNASMTTQPAALPVDKSPALALHLKCESDGTSAWVPFATYPTAVPNAFLQLELPQLQLNACPLSQCDSSKCAWTMHGSIRVFARTCCSDDTKVCRSQMTTLRNMCYVISVLFALCSIAIIPMVFRERRRQQQEARGWALMELFFTGATLLYLIPLIDWFNPRRNGCWIAVWLREVGFILFYGSVVLKIYRNLQEYRVRKAHHVFVREQDLLKYLAVLTGFTILGLLAWSFGSTHNDELWESAWPRCPVQKGVAFWSVAELVFLLYGMRLCYKAHRSSWVERYQFSLAVVFEAFWTCVFTIWRYIIRDSGSEDALFFLFIAQLHLTVSANIAAIIAPKFVFVTSDNNRRTLAMAGGGSSSGRAHPSLAKLRDNLINGTTDFAEIPIVDMNPEDIRAELKRVYTQLRMYKLKNLYQDNPHVSKRKGGKKTSDKTTKNRRISIPPTSSSPKARRLDEEEEKSDLTVESAPHNVYLSTNKIQLDSADQSVRV